jgi:hypothetical protein
VLIKVTYMRLGSGQCWESVTFFADPDLCLMDPDPTPDPTPFFHDSKDAKKIIFVIFFLITYPQAHYLPS